MELSLYTPPVTPPTEDKVGTKESTGSNKSPPFNLLELGDISSTQENRNVMNGRIAGIRALPKIVNIEKANINFKKTRFDIDKQCDNKKIQEHEHSFNDATIMDTFKNFGMSDSTYSEFGSSVEYQSGSERSESGKLQSDATVNGVKTSSGADALPETMTTLVDLNVTNNLNTTNESIANISNGDIDTLLEDILNSENHMSIEINDDWLNLLMD